MSLPQSYPQTPLRTLPELWPPALLLSCPPVLLRPGNSPKVSLIYLACSPLVRWQGAGTQRTAARRSLSERSSPSRPPQWVPVSVPWSCSAAHSGQLRPADTGTQQGWEAEPCPAGASAPWEGWWQKSASSLCLRSRGAGKPSSEDLEVGQQVSGSI